MPMNGKIPATKALLVFFWVIAAVSLIMGGYLIFVGLADIYLLASGLLVILGGLLLACLVRMVANIGQMVFDIKAFLMGDLNNMLTREIQESRETLRQNLANLDEDLKKQAAAINTNCEQINCDTKDINNNIQRLRSFFEQIEKHLRLK